MELLDFIIEAKKNGYGNKKAKRKKVIGSGKVITYKKRDFEYKDIYFGSEKFIGQEIVLKNKKVIWLMNYSGKVINEKGRQNQEKIYQFIQDVLMKVDKKSIFRGPKKYKKGKLRYKNEFKGNINFFVGKEKIFYEKKLVYILFYHGGNVKL